MLNTCVTELHWDTNATVLRHFITAILPFSIAVFHMKNLTLFILISFSASAEEVELSAIFGDNDYLDKRIELVVFLSAASTQGPTNSNESSKLPVAYFYASEQALVSGDKNVLFFDWPTELCDKNNCTKYLDKKLKVRCEIRYLAQPVNFHSVTNIVNIEVLNDQASE